MPPTVIPLELPRMRKFMPDQSNATNGVLVNAVPEVNVVILRVSGGITSDMTGQPLMCFYFEQIKL